MIEINDKKSIGRVLFIDEGSKTEFAILRKIFCDILKYEYIEKEETALIHLKVKITVRQKLQ